MFCALLSFLVLVWLAVLFFSSSFSSSSSLVSSVSPPSLSSDFEIQFSSLFNGWISVLFLI